MNGAISQEEKHGVSAHGHNRLDIVLELSKERCKESGSAKSHLVKRLLVHCYNVLDADNVWICSVSIYGEAVAHSAIHAGRLSTESKDREGHVIVIRL